MVELHLHSCKYGGVLHFKYRDAFNFLPKDQDQ
jgi:hypothetical protein